ncbi:MAG: short-chain dehydrogenase [Armatimonadetes bacterium CG2_30_59_28]|nr:SDR family oxidoreductase [Armatimonadota bacterium]OIO97296.1 MAG: short-chain dehydrogenase [Armatimonadetes bacterium CG2_30_59_28]PIU61359.1 MAG: short-chain dehydrogenase [Armatimonadetes bacterium CG07_land_8_20_14_0_80_59_28]PIX38790.1 MAG: short-chain dehydrogenase [Armatimonadetes bacterium CG_4_8_14_3_um_filter_58_9]PIY40837.1 MAG: short-chain dehydrogenase [Armatimonadetes bacterium CG_4_10_14_3_um_filter_59_10]PJB61679.1 MAG: short-chain dehydrogenase [Armatimonadetes bacterium 
MSSQELFDLHGKVAFVTGGAGFLGTAFCEALSDAGARVVIASRDVSRCQELADRLDGDHLAMELDLSDAEGIQRAIDATVEQTGRIDILVNNGYRGASQPISETTADDFQASFQVGVTSYFVASKHAHGYMKAVGGGSIINIGSMYGIVGSYPDAYAGLDVCSPANYHALKGAVVHLTRHLAVYWARDNVRVNCLSPGPFPSTLIRQEKAEFVRRLESHSPMSRMGEPEELKGALLLLASGAGSYITGHNLVVDGGWTAW